MHENTIGRRQLEDEWNQGRCTEARSGDLPWNEKFASRGGGFGPSLYSPGDRGRGNKKN